MRGPGRTRPFPTAVGGTVPQGVAEVGECRLGGVDQWVLVRGRELANPPLIHLHGGPGFSETRLLRHFNSDIENRFTVVYRDQRGTGKSFRPSIPRSSMTVEQFLTDLYELVDMVCARVGKEQVVLHGHSWGSLLGVLYADRHPERIAAYLGTVQIDDAAAAESASYTCPLAAAELRRNRRVLEALRAIGPPPIRHPVSSPRTWLQRLDGQSVPFPGDQPQNQSTGPVETADRAEKFE
ncbi:alpha/beta fold hydrolase [Mycolicibacterium pyrenivorans]|uniref:alpha/beta fold hydrolase n=1 Tax=Mycolicibacterium pyrenivorans TaxID=187102 RepID=UPI0021F36507|nr:alpha/beta hydrolase [Mycolicibacterium pyrenivorans]